MIRTGDILENPVTGERMHFLKTSADTQGEYVLIELTASPGAVVAAKHVHPYQAERFDIVSGRFAAAVDGREIKAGPGDVLTVEPGQSHVWWNAGDEDLVFRAEVRPALRFEQLIETMFGLAADGKTNRKGMPNPLRLAVIAKEHFDDVRLPFPPVWMQRIGLALGAPVGRALGFSATYEPAGNAAPYAA